jgi:RND family efflux transporter MFP subunit
MLRQLSLVVVAALALACSGKGDDDDAKKPPVPVTVVEVETVATGEVADLLLASATVEAERSADLVPSTTGIVKEVRKDVGDPVRQGEVLAVLDNVTLDAGAEKATADVAHLEAQLAELERLAAKGATSQREVDDLRYQLATARTSLRQASRSAGEQRLVAPFDGVVAARDLKVGELATGAKRAFQVVDLRDLRVHARLPERDVGRVRIGQTARLVSAYDADAATTATVTRIAPVIDSTSGTFEVTLALPDGQSALRPGQFVSVELEVDRHTDVVVVPKDAVRYEAGRPIAFVMVDAPPEAPDTDAENDEDVVAHEDEGPRFVARRVEVELGLTDAERSEVTAGLSAGDRLIVVGQATLRDGARIREASPAPAAPATKGAAEVGPATVPPTGD